MVRSGEMKKSTNRGFLELVKEFEVPHGSSVIPHTHPTHEFYFVFFFKDTATTENYTLSLHDALPICKREDARHPRRLVAQQPRVDARIERYADRKSTRLNSSHVKTSYAVFCLKK